MHSPNSADAAGDTPTSADDAGPTSASAASEAGRPATQARSSLTLIGQQRLWALAILAFVAWLLLAGLSRYGIWDPWELETADAARERLDHPGTTQHSLGVWLVSVGFRLFGIHEWAGRLPIALTGVLCAMVAFVLARRYGDLRTGAYAALIAATTPLLAFNARTMLGAAPDMAVSGALGLCVLAAVLPAPGSGAREAAWQPSAWLLAALAWLVVAVATRGALLAALPPLGAASAAAWLTASDDKHPARRINGYVLGACWLITIALVARDVRRDAADYSIWLGGAVSSGDPSTFDAVLEQVFHAFAPWSALLPIAFSRVPFGAGPAQSTRQPLLHACMLWAALGYGAQTFFVSRYGQQATFLAVVPLAVLLASTLRDFERDTMPAWGAALAVLLLAGLLLRDFALFPNGLVQGMPLGSFELPAEWNPRGALAAVCIPFGLCAALALAVSRDRVHRPDLRAPYRFLATQWRRGKAFKAWLLLLAALVLGLCAFGALAYAIPQRLHMPSLAVRIVRRLTYTPLVLLAIVAASQLALYMFARFGRQRFIPLLVAGSAFGTYLAQGYLPELSEHFSPRDVYTTYNTLAAQGAVLAEYRVGGRAAPYYADGPVIEVTSLAELIDHLAQSGQRWATFPASDLANIDHAFRKRTGRHLFLVDAQSERGVLAASDAIPGREDQSKLAPAVRQRVPETIEHPVEVNFDDRIRLLGYSLKLPHKDYIGAGESFTLTWYFRSTRKLTSSYRIFVHIDGEGQRIHGDHDPVDSAYPVTLWEPGDIIVDEQKIDVPASAHAGEYSILMGFYSGDTRLPIRQGPNAGEDRARVGALRIR